MLQTSSKIKLLKEANIQVEKWKKSGLKIVFTNGCFDILHFGHVSYLEKSKNLGNKLVVGLNNDNSVRKIKGNNRPFNKERNRARVLAALEFVDLVILFGAPTPLRIILKLLPDILVKGKDYDICNIVGADIVKKNGGKIKTIGLVKNLSTTNILNKLSN